MKKLSWPSKDKRGTGRRNLRLCQIVGNCLMISILVSALVWIILNFDGHGVINFEDDIHIFRSASDLDYQVMMFDFN